MVKDVFDQFSVDTSVEKGKKGLKLKLTISFDMKGRKAKVLRVLLILAVVLAIKVVKEASSTVIISNSWIGHMPY